MTGHILEVSFRMKRISSPWIYEERERFGNVDALIEGLKTLGEGVAADRRMASTDSRAVERSDAES